MDESLVLLQYALTGETLKGSVIEKLRLKDQYPDSEDWSFFYSTRDLFSFAIQVTSQRAK